MIRVGARAPVVSRATGVSGVRRRLDETAIENARDRSAFTSAAASIAAGRLCLGDEVEAPAAQMRDMARAPRRSLRAGRTARSARTARTAGHRRLPWRARAAASPPARGTEARPQLEGMTPGDAVPAGVCRGGVDASIASAKRRAARPTAPASRPRADPVRASAASDRPPTRIGIGGAGAGRMAPRRSKNRPRKSTSSPCMNSRRHRNASVVRAPRSRGSIPHNSSSLGSSPPTPTPKVNLPGASSAIVASCRATTAGWRSASRYTPVWTDNAGWAERSAAAWIRPSAPWPSAKLTWSPTVR